MQKTKKRTVLVLCLLGLAYFIVFIFPNASTLNSDNPLVYLHKDEYVTYPVVERMLALEGTPSNIWGQWIIYQDYHYGYPFYLLSALLLLPFRLIEGQAFYGQISRNILILRQMINVLPMILTAGVLTYVQTRYRTLWRSVFIFIFLLTIPAVVRSNMHWWHPDSLMLLAIALTFYFLDRDGYQLGKEFFLAGAACGMASAIKLTGFFFFLTIPIYLLLAWQKRRMPFRHVTLSAIGFLAVMVLMIVLSNPFVFYEQPRADMLAIQQYKTEELSKGYSHDEARYYSTGPYFWRWTFKEFFGPTRRMRLFLAALALGIFLKAQRRASILLTAWVIPLGIYLLWFVAPKPDHYLLPLMLPMLSGILNPISWFKQIFSGYNNWLRIPALAGLGAYAAILIQQISFQISTGLALYLPFIQ